ncbi:hypothetical protein DVH24_035123 [Malus domestica]|uniref:Uncharacterized protein n=1 Tax=Malus domestica TaxID=3750 RepID=A0A498II38_MALDO|nr:hypothetical protein DVH24_035123 [Malus domestica]
MRAEREAFILQAGVDFRILRAIAIEHPFDADAAILDVQSPGTPPVQAENPIFSHGIGHQHDERSEVQEKAVDIVQEEASRGALDIMVKVEELKQMLAHAKEANDMVHAGEVFGEKAILATEARELQSRLLNLSDERDKSLAILNEVDST